MPRLFECDGHGMHVATAIDIPFGIIALALRGEGLEAVEMVGVAVGAYARLV